MHKRFPGVAALVGIMFLAGGGTGGGATLPQTSHDTSEAGYQAKRAGLDYDGLYRAALHHREALPAFLALHAGDFLDGAGSQDYCDDLFKLLQTHGDRTFAAAARNFSLTMRCAILDDLYFGYPGGFDMRNFPAQYPQTEALAGQARGTCVVKKGDTLEKIARQQAPGNYRELMTQISTLNHLESVDTLKIGMTLKLP